MYLDHNYRLAKNELFFFVPDPSDFHFLCGAHVEGFFFRHQLSVKLKDLCLKI